jgi:hypothetical protein
MRRSQPIPFEDSERAIDAALDAGGYDSDSQSRQIIRRDVEENYNGVYHSSALREICERHKSELRLRPPDPPQPVIHFEPPSPQELENILAQLVIENSWIAEQPRMAQHSWILSLRTNSRGLSNLSERRLLRFDCR